PVAAAGDEHNQRNQEYDRRGPTHVFRFHVLTPRWRENPSSWAWCDRLLHVFDHFAVVAGAECVNGPQGDGFADEADAAVGEASVRSARVEAEPFVVRPTVVVRPRASGRPAERGGIVIHDLRTAGGVVRLGPAPVPPALAVNPGDVAGCREPGVLRP